MQINSLTQQLANPLSLLSGGGQAEKKKTEHASEAASPTAAPTPSLIEILSRYDVHDMTPNDFVEMLNELRKAGEISDDELKELSLLTLQMNTDNVDSDIPIDLIAYLQGKLGEASQILDSAEKNGAASPDAIAQAKLTQSRSMSLLDWLEKFDAIQKSGQKEPIDLLA